MARIRTIKPEFWVDEKVTELSAWARLLFIGLWNFADDEGRMEYSPKRLKMQIFPGDDVNCANLVDELAQQQLVAVYEIDGQRYLQVAGFAKHQKIDRRTPSKHPAPPVINEVAPPTLDESRRVPPNPAEPPQVPPTEGKGKERKRKGGEEHNAPYAAIDDLVAAGVDPQKARDWLAGRKRKRAVETKTAIEGVLKRIAEAGLSADEGIQICCERGWVGFDGAWLNARASPVIKPLPTSTNAAVMQRWLAKKSQEVA